jgi:hypothetical protein
MGEEGNEDIQWMIEVMNFVFDVGIWESILVVG